MDGPWEHNVKWNNRKILYVLLSCGIWKSWTQRRAGWWLAGAVEIGGVLVKGYKCPAIKWICSRNLIYVLWWQLKSIVLYTWKLLREEILCVITTHTHTNVIMWGDVDFNYLIVIFISGHKHVEVIMFYTLILHILYFDIIEKGGGKTMR